MSSLPGGSVTKDEKWLFKQEHSLEFERAMPWTNIGAHVSKESHLWHGYDKLGKVPR